MDNLIERVPPNNIDAERAVLGAMLLDKEAVARVLEIISFRHFYVPNHQIIFKVLYDLFNQGLPVDLITASDSLRIKGVLEDIGGYTYLMDISESVPTTANVEQYAKIVEEKFIRRELIRISTEISDLAYESTEDIAKLIENSERLIFSVGQRRFSNDLIHIKELLVQNFENISGTYGEDGAKLPINTGISTGIKDLDEITNGLNPSDLIILAARPAMGKTAFCLNLATNIAIKEKLPVAIFSLEMSKEQMTQRIVCAEAEISAAHFKTGNIPKESWPIITQTIGKLYDAPLYIDDTSTLTPIEIRAKVRRLKAEHKNIGAVIIDYLQLMEDSGSENRVQEIAKITRSLKKLAREMNVPVIALSQLSRNLEQRNNKRPQLSDLRESGSIEQDADIVMFIYRDEYYNPDSDRKKIAELIIAKHRNGPVDTVDLFFDATLTKFSGLEK